MDCTWPADGVKLGGTRVRVGFFVGVRVGRVAVTVGAVGDAMVGVDVGTVVGEDTTISVTGKIRVRIMRPGVGVGVLNGTIVLIISVAGRFSFAGIFRSIKSLS